MSTKGFEFTKTDSGTERKAREGLERGIKYNKEKFEQAIMRYWWKVWQDARRLCIEYGIFDTGTLYNTIRIEWNTPMGFGGGPTYEVAFGPDRVEVTGMIRAGGMLINPKTGRIVNYAESVHEGTGKNLAKGPRRFLVDAILMNEGFLEQILRKYTKGLGETVVGD